MYLTQIVSAKLPDCPILCILGSSGVDRYTLGGAITPALCPLDQVSALLKVQFFLFFFNSVLYMAHVDMIIYKCSTIKSMG